MSGPGHNSAEAVAVDRLRAFVQRIERLAEERDAISADIREIYAEAKGDGFDTRVMRALIRRRKMDRAEREERDALLGLYESGMGAE